LRPNQEKVRSTTQRRGRATIRRRFPWLELIWADGGYNAWQVDAAAAKVPPLRIKIVKRGDDMRGFATKRVTTPASRSNHRDARHARVKGRKKENEPLRFNSTLF